MLHRVTVADHVTDHGLMTFTDHGTPITVEGQPMVRLSWGTILPAVGFSPSEAEARHVAADRMVLIARRILEQARRLREPIPATGMSGDDAVVVAQRESPETTAAEADCLRR